MQICGRLVDNNWQYFAGLYIDGFCSSSLQLATKKRLSINFHFQRLLKLLVSCSKDALYHAYDMFVCVVSVSGYSCVCGCVIAFCGQFFLSKMAYSDATQANCNNCRGINSLNSPLIIFPQFLTAHSVYTCNFYNTLLNLLVKSIIRSYSKNNLQLQSGKDHSYDLGLA